MMKFNCNFLNFIVVFYDIAIVNKCNPAWWQHMKDMGL